MFKSLRLPAGLIGLLQLAGSSIYCLLGHLQPWQSAPISKIPEYPILTRPINDQLTRHDHQYESLLLSLMPTQQIITTLF